MGNASAIWSTFILMKWFGVSAQLQLLNANHCVILAHGITSALLMRGQNQYRGQKCTIGRRAANRPRDSLSLQFPWQHRGRSVLNVRERPTEHAKDWLLRVYLYPHSSLHRFDWIMLRSLPTKCWHVKPNFQKNQYQRIAQATLER